MRREEAPLNTQSGWVFESDMLVEVAGQSVYLAMARDENRRLKLKPQNLLLNLPTARRS